MKLRYVITIPLSNDEREEADKMLGNVRIFQDCLRMADPFFSECIVTAELIDDTKPLEEAACPSSTVPLPEIKDSLSAPPMG